jgi:hypothetical protein
MKKKMIVLLSIGAIGIIAFALIWKFVYNKPHMDYAAATADHSLTPLELYEAFTLNYDEAMELYIGRMIEVTGKPDAIEQVGDLVIAAFHFGDGPFGPEGVRCTFIEGYDAQHVQSGQTITIKGYCTGFTGEDVILENCTDASL